MLARNKQTSKEDFALGSFLLNLLFLVLHWVVQSQSGSSTPSSLAGRWCCSGILCLMDFVGLQAIQKSLKLPFLAHLLPSVSFLCLKLQSGSIFFENNTWSC